MIDLEILERFFLEKGERKKWRYLETSLLLWPLRIVYIPTETQTTKSRRERMTRGSHRFGRIFKCWFGGVNFAIDTTQDTRLMMTRVDRCVCVYIWMWSVVVVVVRTNFRLPGILHSRRNEPKVKSGDGGGGGGFFSNLKGPPVMWVHEYTWTVS